MKIWQSLIRLVARSNSSVGEHGILQIPLLEPELLDVPASHHSLEPTVRIDFGSMSCTCEDWTKDRRSTAAMTSIGRCCKHMAHPVYMRICMDKSTNPWTKAILEASEFYPPPAKSEMAIFSNGKDDFVALYDIHRGYIQLYGPLQFCQQFGYDLRQNRWGWGNGPANPMVVKKIMRPWAKTLEEKYGHEYPKKNS